MAAEGSAVGCPVGRKVPSTGAASRIPGYDAIPRVVVAWREWRGIEGHRGRR